MRKYLIGVFLLITILGGVYFSGIFKDKSFNGVINRFEEPYQEVLSKLVNGDEIVHVKYDVLLESIHEGYNKDLSAKGTFDYRREPFTLDADVALKLRDKKVDVEVYNVFVPEMDYNLFVNLEKFLLVYKSTILGDKVIADANNGEHIDEKTLKKLTSKNLNLLEEKLRASTVFELVEEKSDIKNYKYVVKFNYQTLEILEDLNPKIDIYSEMTLEINKWNEGYYSLKGEDFSIISTKKGIDFSFNGEKQFNLKRKGFTRGVLTLERPFEFIYVPGLKIDKINFDFGLNGVNFIGTGENSSKLQGKLSWKGIKAIREN